MIVLICISLVTKHFAYLSRAYWPFVCMPVRVICLFLNHVGCFTSSLHWVLSPSQIYDLQIFSPILWVAFFIFFLRLYFFKAVIESQQNSEDGTEILHKCPFPATGAASPSSASPAGGTFIMGEPALTCHYHPKSNALIH